MTLLNKDKQLVFLAVSFMYQFIEDKDTKLYKKEFNLLKSLSKIFVRIRKDMDEQLMYAYKQLDKILGAKDVTVNPALFSVNCVFNLCESDRIDEKLRNKLRSDSMNIYNAIEKQVGGDEEFTSTNKLIKDFTRTLC